MSDSNPSKDEQSREIPRWLRYLLMLALVIAAGIAFYFNNLKIIERLTE